MSNRRRDVGERNCRWCTVGEDGMKRINKIKKIKKKW